MSNDWTYQPATDIDRSLAERLQGFPREPDLLVYALRSLSAFGLRAWLRLYHRFKIVGGENLPKSGSFVLISNHSSHLDALTLMSTLPFRSIHRTFPVAAKDYFFCDLPRSAFAAIFINALPFGRLSHQRESLTICGELLKNEGNILILFPEGSRSVTGEMSSFKAGVGCLVAGTPIPVIPCYLQGTFDAWPKGTWFPKPQSVTVRVGKPLTFADRPNGKPSAELIAAELQAAVSALRESHQKESSNDA